MANETKTTALDVLLKKVEDKPEMLVKALLIHTIVEEAAKALWELGMSRETFTIIMSKAAEHFGHNFLTRAEAKARSEERQQQTTTSVVGENTVDEFPQDIPFIKSNGTIN